MKIGIIKEGKVPVDHRVPFTPLQCAEIQKQLPSVEVVVQPSDIRCFPDAEYVDARITLQEDLSDCDILFGVKEVPMDQLLPGKRYFFFSHTIKKQPYNKELLQTILKQNIALTDYECLTDPSGKRVVAFGRFAGIVGAYNGLLTYGKKHKGYTLKPAHQCFDMKELWAEFDKIELPPIKIALTGGGRVARGAEEVLQGAGVRKVSSKDYLEKEFDHAVYVQLDSDEYHERDLDGGFDFQEFYAHPDRYQSLFLLFAKKTDMLIAGAFWDPNAPVLFTREDMKDKGFHISVIADVTCDIEGSIPSTIRPSTIDDPIYDYDPASGTEIDLFQQKDAVTVMAVDNLPCELPRDASESFGDMLLNHVIPDLEKQESQGIIRRATICEAGELTERFKYLSDYIAD